MNHAFHPGQHRERLRCVRILTGVKWRALLPAPPPLGAGAGGWGPTTAPQRPKGEGRQRPGREGPAPANGDRARPTGPGRSEAPPTRRAAPSGAPRTKQNPSFVQWAGDRAHGPLLTKLGFCLVRPMVAAAELCGGAPL